MTGQLRRPTAAAVFGGYGLLVVGLLVLGLEVHDRSGAAEVAAVIAGFATFAAVTGWLWRKGAWQLDRLAHGPPQRRSASGGLVGAAVLLVAIANQVGGPVPIALLAGALGIGAAFVALITALLFRNGPARSPN